MTFLKDPRIAQLPGVARALAEELGYDMGIKLMVEFGGMQVPIPKRPLQNSSKLWQVLGEQAAKTLSRLYGPGQIDVPIGESLKAAERNRAIAKHEGSHNETARAFGVTRRWVKMVRRAHREGPGPLFDRASTRTS